MDAAADIKIAKEMILDRLNLHLFIDFASFGRALLSKKMINAIVYER